MNYIGIALRKSVYNGVRVTNASANDTFLMLKTCFLFGGFFVYNPLKAML